MASHNNVSKRRVRWEVQKTANGKPLVVETTLGTTIRLFRTVYHGKNGLVSRGGKRGIVDVIGSLRDAYAIARQLTRGEEACN